MFEYFITFFCHKCRTNVTERVQIEGDFDAVEAMNVVIEKNLRGSVKAMGKCKYPGQGHEIANLSLSGVKHFVKRVVPDIETPEEREKANAA